MMKKLIPPVVSLFLFFTVSYSYATELKKESFTKEQIAELASKEAIIHTSFGDIRLQFFPEVAPNHVKNFQTLAKSGFYNHTIFHRVIPGFMIQGGDPNSKDIKKRSMYGMGGPDFHVAAEFNNISHKRGILSMARSSNPDSAGSQFFITVADAPFLDHQYTVFGKVISGMDVADKIVSSPRDGRDNPLKRIEMTIEIVDKVKKVKKKK